MRDLSYQLFSSRNFPTVRDTLGMLAELGYRQVEGFGGVLDTDANVGDTRDALDATGLTMPTAHVGLDLLSDPDRTIPIAAKLGINTVFGPYLPEEERPSTIEDWAAFGTQLAALAAPYWDAGLGFGWHNHDFEFTPIVGAYPIEAILAADPRLKLEMDVAWVVRAEEDPFAWMTKLAGRIHALHIKDIAPKGENREEDGWADVGHGTLDWAGLLGAAEQTSAEVFVLEHDNPSDPRRFASRSFATVQGL